MPCTGKAFRLILTVDSQFLADYFRWITLPFKTISTRSAEFCVTRASRIAAFNHQVHYYGVICVSDPSVMGASLILMHAMIAVDPLPFKDLVSSFTSILKQIVEHRLPREYDYHRIPAPWIQVGRSLSASSVLIHYLIHFICRCIY